MIVGAGLAGAKAAETLRAEGFAGRVVLIGAEPERPYERPPLSKGYLRGEMRREEACVHDAGFYAEHEIELRTGDAAPSPRPDDRRELALDSASGSPLTAAAGHRPSRGDSHPRQRLDGIHYLRTLADSDALRAGSATAAGGSSSAPAGSAPRLPRGAPARR